MPAYFISETLSVSDPDAIEKYRSGVGAVVEQYGGRYLARAAPVVLEGEWAPGRIVMLEFDDVEAAKRFHDAPEYRELRDLRQSGSKSNIIVVPGA